jgi:hypothetical protein
MTEDVPAAPDWTRRCKVSNLDEIPPGSPYMLRTSDDPASQWRSVRERTRGFWTDEVTGDRFHYLTVRFHDADDERLLNDDDEIEVGFIRPPWWPADAQPPEWPTPPS